MGPCHAKTGSTGWIEMIIQKASEIHSYIFGSMCSAVLDGHGWCDLFMSQHDKFTLRMDQLIKRARNKASLGGL